MDATVDSSLSAAIPSVLPDALANGDQWTPLETSRQTEAINSPLQPEVIAKEKNEDAKEKEKSNTPQTHGVNSELEKLRIDFELTMLKRQHEENEKQRQHEEKMELMRQQTPSRTVSRGEEEQLGRRLDPVTEIEFEKMRMEFEMAKLKQISEENEKQRQHERKMHEGKEKQQQQLEGEMGPMHQRLGLLRLSSQKTSPDCKVEATAETTSVASAEVGKVKIEVQLAIELHLPEMNEKRSPCDQRGCKEIPNPEQQVKSSPEERRPQAPSEQQETNGLTEHLGPKVPCIVVSGAEPLWSTSRLDLATETELEKRRMEFELVRLKYEHEDHERQRQHEEKMEQLRQQALPRESE